MAEPGAPMEVKGRCIVSQCPKCAALTCRFEWQGKPRCADCGGRVVDVLTGRDIMPVEGNPTRWNLQLGLSRKN